MMSDLISIQQGGLPWRPAEESELLDTLHYYDMPLAGVIRQVGILYFFWAVAGQVEEWTLWAYAWISDEEREAILRAEDYKTVLDAATGQRPLVIAVSQEGRGIVASALLEKPGLYPSIAEGAREAFRSSEIHLGNLIST